MPSIDTTVKVEEIEHLDFAAGCQALYVVYLTARGRSRAIAVRACSEPAAWLGTCRTCGARWLLCDAHRATPPKTVCQCPRCSTEAPVDELASFEPLDPGARP